MIVFIMGPASSGKTIATTHILNAFHFDKVTHYTSRQKRSNEIEGAEYHFVTNSEFEELLAQNIIHAYVKPFMYDGENHGFRIPRYYGFTVPGDTHIKPYVVAAVYSEIMQSLDHIDDPEDAYLIKIFSDREKRKETYFNRMDGHSIEEKEKDYKRRVEEDEEPEQYHYFDSEHKGILDSHYFEVYNDLENIDTFYSDIDKIICAIMQ